MKIGTEFRIEIIASKSRVAPLKVMTIPRLELCAANLLASLLKTVKPVFEEGRKEIAIQCWSDSQVVLQWLTTLRRKGNENKTFFVLYKE